MKHLFRIHGDNIIECERIITLIKNNVEILNESKRLVSQAVIEYSMDFSFNQKVFSWIIELFPGFDKRNRARWEYNIFEALKKQGSFLDETPDAILTRVEKNEETVVMAIEFSSALNAGNQAWQRSGRAFSTAKIGSPYLFLDEFVRYELESSTRKRKNLRFANAAIPYSYLNMSKTEDTFIVQAFFKSEEFDKKNINLKNFNKEIFSEHEVSNYIILSFAGEDTSSLEDVLMHKNLEMVKFLSPSGGTRKAKKEITKEEWEKIFIGDNTVIDCSKNKNLSFRKNILTKSLTESSKTKFFNDIVSKYANGISSEGLPFGVIDKNQRPEFSQEVNTLYSIGKDEMAFLKRNNTDLLVCLVKGFKPKGDDNRPDRGILPFLTMLTSEKYEILSYIYGPMSEKSINLFINNFEDLARKSGFWNVFLSMSDAVLLDVPLLKTKKDNFVAFQITQDFKNRQLHSLGHSPIKFKQICVIPKSVHEDDVDTAIHSIFTSFPSDICFESSCNPPGGDWSGISIRQNDSVYRWLSLPRAPKEVKRPDHIIELKDGENLVLLIIESKDYPKDVIKEGNLDKSLKAYLENLMNFSPSAIFSKKSLSWEPNNDYDFLLSIDNFIMITAAAYINKDNVHYSKDIFKSSNCDMLFIFTPVDDKDEIYWELNIETDTQTGKYGLKLLKEYKIIEIAGELGISII